MCFEQFIGDEEVEVVGGFGSRVAGSGFSMLGCHSPALITPKFRSMQAAWSLYFRAAMIY